MPKLPNIIVRVAAIVVITVLALETALQLAFPQLPQALIERMPQYRERAGFRLDTDHGAREYPAGQQVDFEVSAGSGDLYKLTCLSPSAAPPFDTYRVNFLRDRHGFRNPEPWPDDLNLAVIGDSFTAAESIAMPYWQGITEDMLVLGLPGSGTLEQQRLFDAFARPRKPENVVFAFFGGNDIHDNQAFADRVSAGMTVAEHAHQGKNPLDYSVVFNLLLFVRDSVIASDEIDCLYPLVANTETHTPVAFYDEFLPILALEPESLLASEMFQLTRESIRIMASAQKERDADFVLMYIPQKAELYWNYLSGQNKQEIVDAISKSDETVTVDRINANMSAQRELLSEMAAELSIDFLDLTPALDSAIREGASPYFFADTHWNQVGHNIAGNALLDFLNRTNLDN